MRNFKSVIAFWLLALLLFCQNGANAGCGDPKKGEQVFKKAGCINCHAGGGNQVNPSAPIKGAKFKKEFPTDKAIADVIRNGILGTPMQGFSKSRISDADLVNLIAYIRSLTP